MAKSQNPGYPDAHPTAPGGMSEKALVAELKRDTTFDDAYIKALSWPEKINHVIQSRLAKDAAQAAAEDREADALTAESGYFDDLDDLLADVYGSDDDDESVAETPEKIMADITANSPDLAAHMVEDVLDTDGMDDGVLDPEMLYAEMVEAREAEQAKQPPPLFIGLPGVRDYIFDGHAGAGPSGAERWMNCTMSLSASRKFLETLTPNQQREYAGAGTAARQGTTAHNAAEAEANFVLGRIDEDELEQTLTQLTFFPDTADESYDDEMGEYITEYVDLIKSYAQDRGGEHVLIESRVEAAIPLTDLHEGEVYVIRGSGDAIVLPVEGGNADDRTLVVADLKYGNGKDVDVNENPQIRLYALGVLEMLADPEDGSLPEWLNDVTYHIAQPRLGGLKTWGESIDDLLAWRDEVLAPALTKALYGADEGATFNPSDLACQWCPARGTCPALTEARVEQAAGLFEALTEHEFEHGAGSLPDATALTDTRLGEMLEMVTGLIDLKDDLKAEAQRRLHRGGSVPGFQLVSYTPPRSWVEDAANRLDPDLHHDEGALLSTTEREMLWKQPVLITPTQAQKTLGDEAYQKIEALVVKPDKRPVVAKVGDRRAVWTGRPPEQMFPAVDGSES